MPSKTTFDDVFNYIGTYGKYQWRVFALLFAFAIPAALQTYLNTFTFATPLHRCRLHALPDDTYLWNESSPEAALVRKLIPQSSVDNETLDSCHYYNHSGVFPNVTIEPNATILECSSWVFDPTYYPDNVVTRLNLYCERETLVALANSLVFVGMLLGSIVFGHVSDRFGRHTSLCTAILGLLIFGVTTAYMKSYWAIVAFRTLSMMCSYGANLSAFVLTIEIFGPSARTTVGMVGGMIFGVGTMVFGALAYYVRPWVWLQLATSIPVAVFLSYYVIVPESPRWLLTQGRLIRFKRVIFAAASANNKSIPQTFIDDLVKDQLEAVDPSNLQTKPKTDSILSLIRFPNMAFKTLVLCFTWFVINTVYYGITMNLTSMPGNPFVKVVVSGAVEIPAHLVTLALMYCLGRRLIMSGTLILAGLSCFLCAWVQTHPDVVNTLAQTGKLAVSASFSVVYIFSGEIFPTSLRTSGIGLCSVCARVGGIVASFVVQRAVDEHRPQFPLSVFGVLGFAAGVLVLNLPETRNKVLPETLDQAETFGRPRLCGLGTWAKKSNYGGSETDNHSLGESGQSLLQDDDSDEEVEVI